MPSTAEDVYDVRADEWNYVHHVMSAWNQTARIRFRHHASSNRIRHRVSWLGFIHRYSYSDWDGNGTRTLHHGFNPIATSRFDIQPRRDGTIVVES